MVDKSDNNKIENQGKAPVVLFVYNRAKHTEHLLETLSRCYGSIDTDLYIYSDGPKENSDKEKYGENISKISEVRNLINDVRWEKSFKSVHITKSEKNKGLANSIISGVSEVINEYGKVIVLEDDLVLAEGFLDYMNQALNAFSDDDKIFAVTGWTYPCKSLKNYEGDAWLYYRACSWGWGTWKNRWDNVVFDPIEAGFEGKLSNEKWCEKFSRGGNDLPGMLRFQLDGKRDSWAIRWNAAACDLDMLTVYPRESFIINDGRDGSGIHCGESAYEQSGLTDSKKIYDFSNITLNKKLVKQAWLFESDTLVKKMKRNLKTIFVDHKVPNVVKRIVH